jgi:hypothetical protein
MGRLLLSLIFVAVVATACGHTDSLNYPPGKTLIITKKVWSAYQEYLAKQGGFRKEGAFLVILYEEIGVSSSYSYCPQSFEGCKYEAINVANEPCREKNLKCVLFGLGKKILIPYEVIDLGSSEEESEAPAAPKPTAAQQAALLPDPEFESPLPDGTIVLSPRTNAAMKDYLEKFNALGKYNRRSVAFFYVSPDGRRSGAVNCVSEPNRDESAIAPRCPEIVTWSSIKPDIYKIHRMARAACESGGAAKCVLLLDERNTGTRGDPERRPSARS